jgi:transcriptional regulator with XRE-family HTH domain
MIEVVTGARMRDLRVKAGLRMGEIASEMGVHRSTISRWEKDLCGFSMADWRLFLSIVNDAEKTYWIRSNRHAVLREKQLAAKVSVR